MNAHAPSVVVIDGNRGNNPDLSHRAHDQAIHRVGRNNVTNEHAASHELVEIYSPTGIHLVRVRINVRRQINLGARNS